MSEPSVPASEGGPLAGRRVLITRRGQQSGRLSARLGELGASVLEMPEISVAPPLDGAPLDRELRRLEQYGWVVFASPNAVHFVRTRMDELGLGRRMLGGEGGGPVRVASLGPATSQAFAVHFPEGTLGLEPEGDFRPEGLLRAFERCPLEGRRVLLPVPEGARDLLGPGLRARGAHVEEVVAYRTVLPEGAGEGVRALLGQGVDLAVFGSPSAVEGFVAVAGEEARVAAVVTGSVTEQAARAAGLEVALVATASTAEGLAEDIRACLQGPRPRSRPGPHR